MKKNYTLALCLAVTSVFSQNTTSPISARALNLKGGKQNSQVPAPSVSVQRNCGTMEHLAKILQDNPSLATEIEQNKQSLQNYISQNYNAIEQERVIYNIPTVVHVVYRNANEDVSNAQIQSQLDVLNKDFRKLNTDINQVPSAWSNLAADVGIEFCLATRDPQGNATSGITRTFSNQSSFDVSNNNVKFNNTGGHSAWPSDQYLNLWVCNLDGTLLGYA